MASRDQRRAEQTTPSTITHKDKFWASYSHIPKKRWDGIFNETNKAKTTKNQKNKKT